MKNIHTKAAPEAIGPYSQAIVANGVVYASGQIHLDPANMEMVEGSVTELTNRVLINLGAVLDAAGSSLQQVVKTTVYLADMGDFPEMNGEYERHFGKHKPARATVQAAGLPKNARVEIDAIALTG